MINITKKFLSFKFEKKDLGDADLILKLKFLKQIMVINYLNIIVLKKIENFGQLDVAPAQTLYDSSIHLKKHIGEIVSHLEYIKSVSFLFLMNYSRPDIAYLVNRVSRYPQPKS